jgi:hypothetical protein
VLFNRVSREKQIPVKTEKGPERTSNLLIVFTAARVPLHDHGKRVFDKGRNDSVQDMDLRRGLPDFFVSFPVPIAPLRLFMPAYKQILTHML